MPAESPALQQAVPASSCPLTDQCYLAVNRSPAGVYCGSIPLFGSADVHKHRCSIDVGMKVPTPPPTRIKSEHLFRQLVSTTGGMQPTSSRAEVTERAGLYTKSCVQGLGYNKIRVWDL